MWLGVVAFSRAFRRPTFARRLIACGGIVFLICVQVARGQQGTIPKEALKVRIDPSNISGVSGRRTVNAEAW